MEESEEVAAGENGPLTWSVRLYEREPGKRAIVFLFAVGAALAGLLLFNNIIFSALALAAILASTAEFWLPLSYRLDKKGASVRCGFSVTAIEWQSVRRVVMAQEGWKLSPHRSEGRTSPFRGVYLRFGKEPEAGQEFVRTHIDNDARYVELGADAGRGAEAPREGGAGDQEAQDGGARDPGAGGS